MRSAFLTVALVLPSVAVQGQVNGASRLSGMVVARDGELVSVTVPEHPTAAPAVGDRVEFSKTMATYEVRVGDGRVAEIRDDLVVVRLSAGQPDPTTSVLVLATGHPAPREPPSASPLDLPTGFTRLAVEGDGSFPPYRIDLPSTWTVDEGFATLDARAGPSVSIQVVRTRASLPAGADLSEYHGARAVDVYVQAKRPLSYEALPPLVGVGDCHARAWLDRSDAGGKRLLFAACRGAGAEVFEIYAHLPERDWPRLQATILHTLGSVRPLDLPAPSPAVPAYSKLPGALEWTRGKIARVILTQDGAPSPVPGDPVAFTTSLSGYEARAGEGRVVGVDGKAVSVELSSGQPTRPADAVILTRTAEAATDQVRVDYQSVRTWVRHRFRQLGELDLTVDARVEDEGKTAEARPRVYTPPETFGTLKLRSLGRVSDRRQALQKLVDKALKKIKRDVEEEVWSDRPFTGRAECVATSFNAYNRGASKGYRQTFAVCESGPGTAVLLHFVANEATWYGKVEANILDIIGSYSPSP